MATTKSTTPRKRAPSRSSSTARTTAASTSTAKSSVKRDDSLVARTGRTIKERPYTSAAIATGAVTVVAAAAAAGAFLASRRDKSFKEASDELTSRVKGGFASASETVKDGLASATETVKELGQRGAGLFKGDGSDQGSETRTQQQIAEEALTLKETGTLDERSATEIKTGAIAY
jgi:hypothetical protein